LVELLAAHAGITIESARLHAQEEQARRTLQGALDSLRQQAATLQQQAELIDLAHDAIIVRDPDGRIVRWNQGATAMYGWSADAAIGRVADTLLSTVFQSSQEDSLRALAALGTWEGELRHSRRNGVAIVVESRQAVVRDVNGAPLSVLEINRDVTASRRAQLGLQLLNDVGIALVSTLDASTAPDAVAEHAVRGLADWCCVLLHHDGRLHIAAEATADPKAPLMGARPLDELVQNASVEHLARSGRTLLLADTGAGDGELDADIASLASELRQYGVASWMEVPLSANGDVLGAMLLGVTGTGRRFDAKDLALAQGVAARAATAVTNARLHARVGELTQLRERARIGRDLHDGIIQDIYAASLQLEDAAEDVKDQKVHERLFGVADQLSSVIADVRTYILGLRARGLEGRPLHEGLASLIDETGGLGGLVVSLEVAGNPYLVSDTAANTLLHITRETLSNVRKHAHATTASAHLQYDSVGVILTVSDNGQGFDLAIERDEQHHGLRNLRGRAEEAGGTFSITATPGAGTTVRVWIPAPH
jgi:PAS domain S-box-containing protein